MNNTDTHTISDTRHRQSRMNNTDAHTISDTRHRQSRMNNTDAHTISDTRHRTKIKRNIQKTKQNEKHTTTQKGNDDGPMMDQ
jgi:hypothetical protein